MAGSVWTLEDAGFITLEVFDLGARDALVVDLNKYLGASSKPSAKFVNALDGVWIQTEPKAYIWRPTIETLANVLNDIVKLSKTDPMRSHIEVDVDSCTPFYRSAVIELLEEPTLPFLVLAIHVDLDSKLMNPSDLKQQIGKLCLPFRLFLEGFNGLTKDLRPGMSPRVSNVMRATVQVSLEHMETLQEKLVELFQLRTVPGGDLQRQASLAKDVEQLEILKLTDDAVPLSSHILAFRNVHTVIGLTEQPGLGGLERPFLLTLGTDADVGRRFGAGGTRLMHIHLFTEGMGLGAFASFGDTMLAWLGAILIWTEHSLLDAINLDREMTTVRGLARNNPMLKGDPTPLFTQVSEIGARAARFMGENRALSRRLKGSLGQLSLGQSAWATEIALPAKNAFIAGNLSEVGLSKGVISSLALKISENLDRVDQSIHEIEGEIAAFQRHISDIVSFLNQATTKRLNQRLKQLTYLLAIFTAMTFALEVLRALNWIK